LLCGAREHSMTLSEFERKRYEKAVSRFIEARRPPPHVRRQLDLSYRLEGQSVEIFEVRPDYRDPSETTENRVAKATYVKRAEEWRIYWQRADLKWHRYEPYPTASSIEEFLAVVDEDVYGCFFG
jgi:hypothetical protein